MAKITAAMKTFFEAAVNNIIKIIKVAQEAAAKLIDIVAKKIKEQLISYQTWLQNKVTELLGNAFPKLAERLSIFIDKVFESLQKMVDQFAKALKGAIKSLADTAAKAIKAAYFIYSRGLELAILAIKGIISGDFSDLGIRLLETALELAGVTDADFKASILKSREAIDAIIADPKGFIKNLIAAAKGGFDQFKGNFKSQVKTIK